MEQTVCEAASEHGLCTGGGVRTVRLPGTAHDPTFRGQQEIASISPLYERTLSAWLSEQFAP